MEGLEWCKPMLKQKKRPYIIQRDINLLEDKQCVSKVLQSEQFRGHLEGVLRGQLDGSAEKKLKNLRKLQENVIPASQIEAARASHQASQQGPAGPACHIIPIDDLRGTLADRYTIPERQARCKLASLYRIIDKMGLTQMIFNHISLRVPGEREHFLINPFGLHYSEVTAANLVKIDLAGNIVDPGTTQLGVNKAGYVIHSAIHEGRKDIKCIVHLHSQYGAAVSAMKCGLLPICQEALVIGEVSYHKYRGIACDEAEKVEIVQDLGPVNRNMLLYNHGLLAMGGSVEEAYINCCNFVRACEIQVSALSAGLSNMVGVDEDIRKSVVSVVTKSGGGVSRHGNMQRGELEYEAEMRALDREGYNTGYPYKFLHLLVPGSDTDRSKDSEPQTQRSKERDRDLEHVICRIREERKRLQRERQHRLSDGSGGRLPADMPSTLHQNGDTLTPSGSHGNKANESPADAQKSSLWSFLDERNASNSPRNSPRKVNKVYKSSSGKTSGGHRDTPSSGGHRDTPSSGGHRDTPSSGVHKDTPSSGGHKDMPSNGVHKDTPSKRVHKDTPSNGAKTAAPVWPADSAHRTHVPHAHSPLVTHVYQPLSSTPHPLSHPQPHPPAQSPLLVQNGRKSLKTDTAIASLQDKQLANSPTIAAPKDRPSKLIQSNISSSSSSGSLHSSSSNTTFTQGNGELDLTALERARTIAEAVAHSTGQSVERLSYHKDQVESHHHKQKRQKRRSRKKDSTSRGLHDSSSSSVSSSGERQRNDSRSSYSSSSRRSSEQHSGMRSPDDPAKQLFGLDKVMHTAEQVAESTGASLQKLGQSRDLNN